MSYVQCYLCLVIFHITWLDTFWIDLVYILFRAGMPLKPHTKWQVTHSGMCRGLGGGSQSAEELWDMPLSEAVEGARLLGMIS